MDALLVLFMDFYSLKEVLYLEWLVDANDMMLAIACDRCIGLVLFTMTLV